MRLDMLSCTHLSLYYPQCSTAPSTSAPSRSVRIRHRFDLHPEAALQIVSNF